MYLSGKTRFELQAWNHSDFEIVEAQENILDVCCFGALPSLAPLEQDRLPQEELFHSLREMIPDGDVPPRNICA